MNAPATAAGAAGDGNARARLDSEFPSLRIAAAPVSRGAIADDRAAPASSTAAETVAQSGAPSSGLQPALRLDFAQAAPPAKAAYEALIVRVFVNDVSRGDMLVLRDARDAPARFLVPAAEYAKWGLKLAAPDPVAVDGERYVVVSGIEGLQVTFDTKAVALNLRVAARALPGTSIDLSPQRRAGVVYPADTSVFLNYGFNATGDDSFQRRRYQFATEFGARKGNWLFYNTTSNEWGDSTPGQFTRLLTNLQYDDRPSLRRLTVGDFFTPGFDLSSSVPLGGVSLSKYYSMDPYFIQYPTAAFRTELAFPSTVQVRVDGNLITQRQVQAGPLDINNITGVIGGQNVSVVVRDPFGREQVLQQPFFFATNVGLKEGLHEYSYNAGSLRQHYGTDSANYGSLAAAGYHRYAFTNQITLGLRGQATQNLYNVGPFGTFQFARFGVVGAGVSVGGRDGSTGYGSSLAYTYTGGNFSFNAGTRNLSRDFAQLVDLESAFRTRSNQYVSGSVFRPTLGTLTATYTAFNTWEGPQSENVNLSYTKGVLEGKGLVSLNYSRRLEPASGYAWLLSFRYFFDRFNSAVAAVGGARDSNTQAVSLQRALPQGEGIGYDFTAGRVGGDAGDGAYGRGFVQVNAAHANLGIEYQHASNPASGTGLGRVFLAGSIGSVGGSFFASRPITDSFALVRIPDLPDVPVYANGWYVGHTDRSGEVVANNLNAYYDNYLSFGAKDLPLDYVFPTSERVISPMTRSGTLVAFAIRKMRAVHGVLVEQKNGKAIPIEFRELKLTRGSEAINGFTARRGEFYVEGVEPGEYLVELNGTAPCTARIRVPETQETMSNAGTVICAPVAR